MLKNPEWSVVNLSDMNPSKRDGLYCMASEGNSSRNIYPCNGPAPQGDRQHGTNIEHGG